ncbi:glycosyltransferase [Lactobacillus sp. UCMA15818]|uniref:glycosyltransferase family 2 protein n=1 Tax=Lactobacillus sp. UCMA15818 TaxID=2583394 RepID=UPI0025B2673B|nr:glycosyltransferase [Lactobacillus sp. UCMA15818]MDN2452732.1 glycosyltransferase family 2 protein [Lactobacillus sp. UCMA15818]
MSLIDTLLIISVFSIWLVLLVNVILVFAGYIGYLRTHQAPLPSKLPFVSVLVPAHNEGIVIIKTIESLLAFDYPVNKYEIIVINDNSSDNSAELLQKIQEKNQGRFLKVINTDEIVGGKGKSNALNIGLKEAKGSVIAVYDADNTPEKPALKILVSELAVDKKAGAVIGKFRTRNKDASLLTRFINIETLSFQWLSQSGRKALFNLCTIPGTNYVIRKELIERMGGWDVNALAEDTEVSFRVYRMNYHINFQPLAVTWEQEPQTFDVWFHQRTRWVKGNIYVILKNLKLLFVKEGRAIRFDLIYLLAIYFLLMFSLIISDITFILSVSGFVHIDITGFSNLLWLFAIILFVVSTFITITTEKGEMTFDNLMIIILMYVVYSQMWLIVAFYGLMVYMWEKISHKKTGWYKTKRYK